MRWFPFTLSRFRKLRPRTCRELIGGARSAAEERQNTVADDPDTFCRGSTLRRPELDARGTRVPQLDDAASDLLGRAGDAEPLERRRLSGAELAASGRDARRRRGTARRPRARAGAPSRRPRRRRSRSRARSSRPGRRASRGRPGRHRGWRCLRPSARLRPCPPSAPSTGPRCRSSAARTRASADTRAWFPAGA